MPKVQRTPRELLATFGIVGEQPPRDLLPDYRATLEAFQFLLTEIPIANAFDSDAAAVAGTVVTVAVPVGEVWFVESAAATMTAVATDNELQIRWTGGVLRDHAWLDGVSKVPGAQNQSCEWSAAGSGSSPIIAKSGDTFQARLINTDAAGVQTLFCFVTRRVVRV